MASRSAKVLTAASLFCLSGWASAQIPAIDIFTVAGVPGTGGSSKVMGPCYCTQQAFFSPVVILQPGTYDFGDVREYWVQSGYTPDGGADQQNLYLLFDPVAVSGLWPYAFPAPVDYAYPAYDLCDQHDDACNARYAGAFQDFELIVTVPPGQNAAQVGLIGHYLYTSSAPEPQTFAMLMLGLTLLASRKRGRSA